MISCFRPGVVYCSRGILVVLACLGWTVPAFAGTTVHHELKVALDPAKQHIEVSDIITLPPELQRQPRLDLLLHASLKVDGEVMPSQDQSGLQNAAVPLRRYVATPVAGRISLHYSGEIFHQVSRQGEEFSGAIDDSAGMISEQGVYLTPASFWYPQLGDGLVSFSLDVMLPQGWKAISQGSRSGAGDRVRWTEEQPQQEIYLVAAPFKEYDKAGEGVEAMVFLRHDDAALANTYLDLTLKYIDMYNRLIGPYPYVKFALVENFWETGFGMPSFTLLGPQVIRLPFIPYTSYPHEILHNWWGNGVYVDYSQGNWSEGLTSYLADHLLKEMRGGGADYRRGLLQGYADYVVGNKDFPLAEFTARHGSSSQAIGYGKGAMLFHMLRRDFGDELFIKALQQFYQQYRFRTAGFDEWRRVFEQVSGRDLSAWFDQWLHRTGAPSLKVEQVGRQQQGGGWVLSGSLRQTQAGKPYRLNVPLYITLAGQSEAQLMKVKMDTAEQPFRLSLSARPLRLDVDPEYDLFRRVDQAEIPPALSKLFGTERAMVVLPSRAKPEAMRGYEQIAAQWQRMYQGGAEVVSDGDLKALPTDRAVWLLGKENRFASQFSQSSKGVERDSEAITIEGQRYPVADDALLLTARNPANESQGLGWLIVERQAAIPGLLRKLPHYGKYSYLVFSGDVPDNIAKGQWPVLNSPLSVVLESAVPAPRFPPRRALSE
jgi:aminopeptidase N